eukprot:g43904.t1
MVNPASVQTDRGLVISQLGPEKRSTGLVTHQLGLSFQISQEVFIIHLWDVDIAASAKMYFSSPVALRKVVLSCLPEPLLFMC